MKISSLRQLIPTVVVTNPSYSCMPRDKVIPSAIPLRDVLTGVFNGSPIPPDYLGEPHEDTKDTPVQEVDPMSNFGFDRLDREAAIMAHAESEGNRARTARSRTSDKTGDMNPAPPSSPASETSSDS